MSADLRCAERLEEQLSDPVAKGEIARLLKVSLATVYASLRQYHAALESGDLVAARNCIPSLLIGKRPLMVVPRAAFIEWYTSAGMYGALSGGSGEEREGAA